MCNIAGEIVFFFFFGDYKLININMNPHFDAIQYKINDKYCGCMFACRIRDKSLMQWDFSFYSKQYATISVNNAGSSSRNIQ